MTLSDVAGMIVRAKSIVVGLAMVCQLDPTLSLDYLQAGTLSNGIGSRIISRQPVFLAD